MRSQASVRIELAPPRHLENSRKRSCKVKSLPIVSLIHAGSSDHSASDAVGDAHWKPRVPEAAYTMRSSLRSPFRRSWSFF